MPNDDIVDAEPVEGPGTELAQVMQEGDPDLMLERMEKKAKNAVAMAKAINTILVTQTFPADWVEQGSGDKTIACLKSAGAERVGRNFPIRFFDSKWSKEEFSDDNGKGYRYVYECKATLYDRTVFAQGIYSTRDKFLGYAHEEWRPLEDINENDIRSAAYHICQGNAVKAILGLRGIPASEFRKIMEGAGLDPTKATTVTHGTGTRGGTAPDDHKKQKELAEICIAISNAGCDVSPDDKGYWQAVPVGISDDRTDIDRAKDICIYLSSFEGKDGNTVKGMLASHLKGKRLDVTLGIARKVQEHLVVKENGRE